MSKRGKPDAAIKRRIAVSKDPALIIERLMEHVERLSETGCWLWRGSLNPSGYGRFHYLGQTRAAHRVAYLLHNGPLEKTQLVLHQCDNKLCVNPAHLKAGTHAENMQEASTRGRMKAHNRILTDADVIEIRSRFRGLDGEHLTLGEEFGVSHSTIAALLNGHTYQHLYPLQPAKEQEQTNMFDPTGTLSTKRPQGSAHHRAKLTAEQVEALRNDAQAGMGPTALGKKYGIGKAHASAIVHGRYRKKR